MAILWLFYGYSMAILWLFYGYSMAKKPPKKIEKKSKKIGLYYGDSMAILWLFYGYFMAILWLFYCSVYLAICSCIVSCGVLFYTMQKKKKKNAIQYNTIVLFYCIVLYSIL